MLLGGAAGLVEARTGAGIYYAVRSGQICARAILTNACFGYEAQVGQELLPDLLTARQSATFYRWLPRLSYLCALYWPGAWQILYYVLCGEYRFREVNRHLGLLGWLWNLLPAYARWKSRAKNHPNAGIWDSLLPADSKSFLNRPKETLKLVMKRCIVIPIPQDKAPFYREVIYSAFPEPSNYPKS